MKTLARKRLSELVEDELVRMITSGEYAPGDRLPSERDLMDLFDVGRPSIREALFSLERMGLVQLGRGDRPRVIEQDPVVLFKSLSQVAQSLLNKPQGVRHFNEARLLFECALARTAAETASNDDIEAMQGILDLSAQASANVAKFRKLDIAFHRHLAEIPNNPIYLAVHEALVEWVVVRRIVEGDREEFNKRSLEGHKAVLDAIRHRSPDDAEAAMRLHLERAEIQWSPYVEGADD
ncbi:transcriptional regulator NanR [Aliiroseovarius sp. PrR006]|uniref:transcriptional regulator NanR n=1 Tax=Aliiroseovarius sp. PrR006 TaxID=2706883 RepID=UPI0013D7A8C5|nr:transcriptional regulator NanR [Aliiroseovarius sp. PrR006]NDW54278.1 transcriptional regulator NanR [Aliiroseovarius sp. PrR006]